MFEKFVILIPAYNPGKSLALLLKQIYELYGDINIVIIDDGSTDGSFAGINLKKRTVILKHLRNKGKGAALKTGINHIYENMSNISAIIFIDADGQHRPKEISNFIDAYKQGKGTFIIGKRNLHFGTMPFFRVLSNRVTTYLLSKKLNIDLLDSQCGYRLIDAKLLRTCFPFFSNGYNFETELVIKAAGNSAKFYHTAIETIYGSEKSYIKILGDTIAFIKLYLQQ